MANGEWAAEWGKVVDEETVRRRAGVEASRKRERRRATAPRSVMSRGGLGGTRL